MRIAHVMRRISFDDWGGTEQVVWNIAKAQKSAGHDVRIFATTALWKGKREEGKEVVDGIEILRFKPVYPWWPMPESLVEELDRKGGNPFVPGLGKALLEWDPDVIHCHAMARIAELCLRVAEREEGKGKREEGKGKREEGKGKREEGKGKKCVISLHGGGANVPEAEAESLRAPTRGRFPWGKILDKTMGWTRRIPEDFGGIVCVGEDEYLKYSERHCRAMYLPNGVDCRLFAAARDARISRTSRATRTSIDPKGPGRIAILCVARIDRQKNQMELVEWLARNPGGSVRLVGPETQPDYRSELEARASGLGVSDRLSFAGALKPGSAELLAEYAKADVFVLPSRHEPFGIVVLEAWAAGIPVAASEVGGLGRLCAAHPGAAATFAPGDAAAMDAAIRTAAECAGDFTEKGLEAAREYDWSSLAEKLVKFYKTTPERRK